MASRASLIVRLSAERKHLSRGLKGGLRDINRYATSVRRIGRSIGRYLVLPMIAAGTASVIASVKMNKGMANVATLIPGNIKRVNELKRAVQDMSMETGKSTADITGGLYQVISAWQDGSDTVERLRINVKAAAAGFAETNEAVMLTSALTKAYGDTSAEAVEHAADLALLTVRLGQTTFPELAGSIGGVTALSKQMNVSMEELMATYATLTGVTGDAAAASTQMRAIFTAMVKPTDAMSAALKKLDVASASQLISERGFIGALVSLMKATDGTEEGLAALFSRVKGLSALFSLGETLTGKYTTSLAAMSGEINTNNEAYAEVTEGINKWGHQIERFWRKIVVASQGIGDLLAPVIGMLAERMGSVVQYVRDLGTEFKDNKTYAKDWADTIIDGTITIIRGLANVADALSYVQNLFLKTMPRWRLQAQISAIEVTRGYASLVDKLAAKFEPRMYTMEEIGAAPHFKALSMKEYNRQFTRGQGRAGFDAATFAEALETDLAEMYEELQGMIDAEAAAPGGPSRAGEALRALADTLRIQRTLIVTTGQLGAAENAVADSTVNVGEAMEDVGDVGVESAGRIKSAFTDAFADILLQADSITDVLRGLIQQMLRIGAERMAGNLWTAVAGSFSTPALAAVGVGSGAGGSGWSERFTDLDFMTPAPAQGYSASGTSQMLAAGVGAGGGGGFHQEIHDNVFLDRRTMNKMMKDAAAVEIHRQLRQDDGELRGAIKNPNKL